MPSTGQLSEATNHGVFAQTEALGKSPDLGRSGGVSEGRVHSDAQSFKVHDAILARMVERC